MHGVIDYAKTAELMAKDESLTIERRYEIACINCLEEEARELFSLVPEERRLEYINTSIDVDNGNKHPELVVYFSCVLSGDLDLFSRAFPQLISRNISVCDYLFFRSLFSGNRATSEYFSRKVNPDEKEFVLVRMTSSVFAICRDSPHYNLLYYLWLMNEEQQERVFRECIGDVLICLLHWPMQSLFMEAVKCGWRHMAHHDYEKVLCAITSKISECQDYNYSQLFSECWSLTPADVKRRLLDDVAILERLYETKEDEFMKLILNEAPARQIDALIDRCCKAILGLQEKFRVLLEEKEMSDAALMEWKETAALIYSSNDEDVEKRARQKIIRLIDIKMESRKKRRL